MKCSVVILNWNGENMLRQFLPSVLEHTRVPDCEIVVADNGSTDDSLWLLQRSFPTVRTIKLEKNYGFAEGYNRALQHVESEYVVLLNSDVEVTPHWLDKMLNYMDEHQDVAAMQPKILSFTQRDRFEHAGAAGGFIDKLGYPYCRGRVLTKIEQDHGQYDNICDIFWASGACMLVRKNDFDSVGGFDDGFFAHMEEIDLCWRMQAQQRRIVCDGTTAVFHLGGGALHYNNPRKLYLNFRNNLLMLYKNMPTARLLIVLFMRFFLDYVACLQNLFIGKPTFAKGIIRARRDFIQLAMQRGAGSYHDKRQHNLANAKIKMPPTITRTSIFLPF